MDSIELNLPYPVSANRYWRNFVPKGRKTAVSIRSREANEYKALVHAIAMKSGVTYPMAGPVFVRYVLIPKRPANWKKLERDNPYEWIDNLKKLDLDNTQKVVLDSLKNVAFADDKFVRRLLGEVGEPAEEPAMIVQITRYKKNQIVIL